MAWMIVSEDSADAATREVPLALLSEEPATKVGQRAKVMARWWHPATQGGAEFDDQAQCGNLNLARAAASSPVAFLPDENSL